ncbi:ligase-associated DNA damage response DEXH box helicase [Mucisphaera sp.]|uniref:ligase-associated DNA damage response DEXH box helicase n=1 Tax=Mucisphaera sp. TaxID=2913024 RepID=UPI003D0AB2E6
MPKAAPETNNPPAPPTKAAWKRAHAKARDWFTLRGWQPAPYQKQVWKAYEQGQSGLVHAPTGTGKTYAVWFGPLIEALAEADRTGPVEPPTAKKRNMADTVRALWITPLRALANDTTDALAEPIHDLGLNWTVEKRTSDTSSNLKAKQRKRLPTALVTTPESLSLLLSFADTAEQLRSVRAVIVDEWHELIASKRGIQTQLCLSYLQAHNPNLRIWGLSATLANLDQAMQSLVGPSHDGQLIRGRKQKQIAVDCLIPEAIERFPWSGHLGPRLVDDVTNQLTDGSTSLIFTNTRSQTEAWFQAIINARPDWTGEVAMHHGSIDRDVREEVEQRLREGSLRCVVCTSSLDLGVDFSPVDRVFQVGSPKGVARLIQRAGRSGHRPGAPSRVTGVPTHAFELIEFAAARRAVKQGMIENRPPPGMALDVLAQHLVTLATGPGFTSDEALQQVRNTHTFANITDAQWSWVLDFVVRGGQTLRAYPEFARVIEKDGRYTVREQKLARTHRLGIGTITADTAIEVRFVSGKRLGTIEESFIAKLERGQRFIFSGRVLELVRLDGTTALVRKATRPSRAIPRWQGGRSPLSTQLAEVVRQLLDEARQGIYHDPETKALRDILNLQQQLSIIPKPNQLLIETAQTRLGHHVFLFAFAGRLAHEGLSSLLAHRLSKRQPLSITAMANDYGLELLAPDPINLTTDDWSEVLSTNNLDEDLIACVHATKLARRRFRQIAQIAGLIQQGYPGQRKPTRHLQASSELFFDVFEQFDPDHHLLHQAHREVLEQELEQTRITQTLSGISNQQIIIQPTDSLSPLAFPLFADRIRETHVSTESWTDKMARIVQDMEDRHSRQTATGNKPRSQRKSRK